MIYQARICARSTGFSAPTPIIQSRSLHVYFRYTQWFINTLHYLTASLASLNRLLCLGCRLAKWYRGVMFFGYPCSCLSVCPSVCNPFPVDPEILSSGSHAANAEHELTRQSATSELWCLSGVSREDYQNCSVLYCVLKLCTVISTLRWAVLTVLWIGFCHTGPISLCVDLFVFICVYFACFCFILHSCCIIVSTVGWT